MDFENVKNFAPSAKVINANCPIKLFPGSTLGFRIGILSETAVFLDIPNEDFRQW